MCADVTGMSGAGITLISGDIRRGSLATTNDVSELIEELQYTLGEGPCIDAYHDNRPVFEPDLVAPAVPRWLAFSGPAIDAGVRAIFGFPLQAGTSRLGALDLYCDQAGSLTDEQYDDALILADLTAETSADGCIWREDDKLQNLDCDEMKKTATAKSIHQRTNITTAILLYHLWVIMG